MREGQIRAAAALFGVKAQPEPPNNEGWMSVGCPYAPHTHATGQDRNPSMRVHVKEGGISHWKCWSCNQGGDLVTILYDLQRYGSDLPYAQLMALATGEGEELIFPTLNPDYNVETAPPTIPEEVLAQYPPLASNHVGFEYMANRSFTPDDWLVWDVRWDAWRNRVCFPIRDMGGALRGLQGRTIVPELKPKYLHYKFDGQARGAAFWMGENLLNFDKPVVICEGAFDAISVARVYSNVVAGMGAASIMRPEKLDRLATAFAVIPFFDGDLAGQQGAEAVRRWCSKKRLCAAAYAPAGRDPGDLSEEHIGDLLGETLAKLGSFV